MSPQPHGHHVELDETFDFINTLEHSAVADTDHIPTAEDALGWLVEHGVLHAEDVERAGSPDEVLTRIRAARQALREVADAVYARRAPASDAVDEVNRTLRARELIVLEPASDGVRIAHRHEGHPLDDALARLAQPLVDELAGGRPERLRVCANDACRWVFFDASPTGRRRWCSMASCGNRAKAARHRARQRKAPAS
jgi:predicted RNA-binding Zn ribbon-like protein